MTNADKQVTLTTTETASATTMHTENPTKRRSSSRLAGSYLSRAGSLSLDAAFSILDEFTMEYDDEIGSAKCHDKHSERGRRSGRGRTSRTSTRHHGRTGNQRSGTTDGADASHKDAEKDTSGGQAEGEGVQRKRARHEDKPRWHTQTYMLVQALRRHPLGECARTELIKSAIAIDAEITRERGLPRVFRGKTPINSASACLTMNKDKLFVAFKPPGARSTHFRLAFELGDFKMAREAYLRWNRTLIEHDWPICFGKMKESARWKLKYVWRPTYEAALQQLNAGPASEEEREAQASRVMLFPHSSSPTPRPASDTCTPQRAAAAAALTIAAALAKVDAQLTDTYDAQDDLAKREAEAGEAMRMLSESECNTVNPSPVLSAPRMLHYETAHEQYQLGEFNATSNANHCETHYAGADHNMFSSALPDAHPVDADAHAAAQAASIIANMHADSSMDRDSVDDMTMEHHFTCQTRPHKRSSRMSRSASYDENRTTPSLQALHTMDRARLEQRAREERAWAFRNMDVTYNPSLAIKPAVCDPSYRQWHAPKRKNGASRARSRTERQTSTRRHRTPSPTTDETGYSGESSSSERGHTEGVKMEVDEDAEDASSPELAHAKNTGAGHSPSPNKRSPTPADGPGAFMPAIHPQLLDDSLKIHPEDMDVEGCPKSLDDIVFVAPSTIPNAGRGLFAARALPSWTPIGFYFGVPMNEDEFDALKDGVGLASHYSIMYRRTVLDATDEDGQPWTDPNALANGGMYCPFHFMNEDVTRGNVAFIEGSDVNQVICMTTQPVRKGEELFAYYGNEVDRHWTNEATRKGSTDATNANKENTTSCAKKASNTSSKSNYSY